ncbi:MAG: T9SS type A sorting domain-containing protein [Flavobacterium sp.]|nr:MAG: T9SS type A sorting domain-containing protein [Flavobacterium sp.]
MKKNMLTAAFLLAVLFTNAQNSAISSGGEAAGDGGTSSHTIGLVAYRADFGEGGSSSQGNQQAYEIYDMDARAEINADIRLSIYPNPAEDFVNVEIAGNDRTDFTFELFSITGKVLQADKLNPEKTSVAMKNYPAGAYLIRISRSGEAIKTFKIIKNQ